MCIRSRLLIRRNGTSLANAGKCKLDCYGCETQYEARCVGFGTNRSMCINESFSNEDLQVCHWWQLKKQRSTPEQRFLQVILGLCSVIIFIPFFYPSIFLSSTEYEANGPQLAATMRQLAVVMIILNINYGKYRYPQQLVIAGSIRGGVFSSSPPHFRLNKTERRMVCRCCGRTLFFPFFFGFFLHLHFYLSNSSRLGE